MLFRKKPITIDAWYFSPEFTKDYGAIEEYLEIINNNGVYKTSDSKTGWMIDTLEGKHEVTPGDWIITGIKGEKYPCKPDIFDLTYDAVSENLQEPESTAEVKIYKGYSIRRILRACFIGTPVSVKGYYMPITGQKVAEALGEIKELIDEDSEEIKN